MLWLTTGFFIVEVVVGYITNSMALVADSFHMLSDVAALAVAFLSVKVSSCYVPIKPLSSQNLCLKTRKLLSPFVSSLSIPLLIIQSMPGKVLAVLSNSINLHQHLVVGCTYPLLQMERGLLLRL